MSEVEAFFDHSLRAADTDFCADVQSEPCVAVPAQWVATLQEVLQFSGAVPAELVATLRRAFQFPDTQSATPTDSFIVGIQLRYPDGAVAVLCVRQGAAGPYLDAFLRFPDGEQAVDPYPSLPPLYELPPAIAFDHPAGRRYWLVFAAG